MCLFGNGAGRLSQNICIAALSRTPLDDVSVCLCTIYLTLLLNKWYPSPSSTANEN